MPDSSATSTPASSGPMESRSWQVVAICLSMLALSSIAVLARFCIRTMLVKGKSGADDWAILVSWAFSVAFIADVVSRRYTQCLCCGESSLGQEGDPFSTDSHVKNLRHSSYRSIIDFEYLETKYGLGKHIYDLPPTTDFSESLKLFYFGEAIYYIVVGTTKVAILILYLRLAVTKVYRILIWTTMAFVVATFLAFVIAGLFQCSPIAFSWDKSILGGQCFDVTALFYANAGVNIFQDVFIYILPMKLIWQVKIPRKQKIALVIVFAVGGFVCVTGMLRLNSLKTASISKDPTWDNFDSAIWSAIESNIGIVCASLPHLKPLISRYMPTLMGLRSNASMTPLRDNLDGTGQFQFKAKSSNAVIEMEQGNGTWNSYNSKETRNHRVAIMGKSLSGDNNSEEQLRDADTESGEDVSYKVMRANVRRV